MNNTKAKQNNQLSTFNFKSSKIRSFSDNGNLWFVANDVCAVLDYRNPRKAISDHCRKDGVTKRYITDSLGRKQFVSIINEPNIYRLIAKSNKPEAEPFEKWVFEEVLPTIRKTGSYSIKVNPEQKSQLINAVSQKVRRSGENHQTVWTMVHNKFKVNSYHELLSSQFDDVMKFLGSTKPTTLDNDINLNALLSYMPWICSWYFKYEPALRILNPRMCATIHDRFVAISSLSHMLSRTLNIKIITREQLEHYPWDKEFYEQQKFLNS